MADFTFVFPCLNEEQSIAACFKELGTISSEHGLTYEIVLVDNGSTDNSVAVAESLGARVVKEEKKGYGNVLRRGISESHTEKVIFADCDGSYDLTELPKFVKALDDVEFVMGHRKYIDSGAQSWLHQYIGVPVLSTIGNVLYGGRVPDWHCGIRGLKKSLQEELAFSSEGMEFASEMILKALKARKIIAVIPVRLRRDLRDKASHLRTFRDGWRHLEYLVKNRLN